jgi:hypothetical protein
MQKLLAPVLALFLQAVLAAPPPVEMDPNTRIQGGADPRGSGAAAGAGVRRDGKPSEREKADERKTTLPNP